MDRAMTDAEIWAELEREYKRTFMEDLERRVFELLLTTPKLKYEDYFVLPAEISQVMITGNVSSPAPAAPAASAAFTGFPPVATMPSGNACNRYNPCGKVDCMQCFPGKVLPPDQKGSKKPGGGGSKQSRAERGYRVVSYDAHLNAATGEKPGDIYSTPDVAQREARRRMKAEKRHVLVLRDGERYQLYKDDGTVLHWHVPGERSSDGYWDIEL